MAETSTGATADPVPDEDGPPLVQQLRDALRGRSRRWWVVGVLGCVAGIAFAVWWGLASNSSGIAFQTVTYRVVDDRSVDVGYEVVRPPGTRVTCLVQALDAHFGAVGSAQVPIPVSSAGAVQQTVRLRTTTRAVTGLVKACSAT